MPNITQICRLSGTQFIVDEKDQAFYAKMNVPLPTLCFEERLRRKMAWRNEFNLHHRKCDLCNKQIISMYHADSPYTVYCNDCWWSDKWNAFDFGKDFDFNRPFFEQMHELQRRVPRLALFQKNCQNCDFNNHISDAKNCYLCSDTVYSEDVYYSKWMIKSRDCIDCYDTENSELCYECEHIEPGYDCMFCMYANQLTNCRFMYECVSCKDCFMCANLYRKQYCIYNQQYTKEQYEDFMSKVDLGSHQMMEFYKNEFLNMIKRSPKSSGLMHASEGCSGHVMDRCKDVTDSFEMLYSRDCRYCVTNQSIKDCYDTFESAFDCSLQYECHGCNTGYNLISCYISYEVSDSAYTDQCHNSNDLFGCVSLRRGKFCILNKQYSEEEYKKLIPRIIEHMRSTKEWGEFFPAANSPFPYNESTAQYHYPLTEEEAIARGFKWRNEDDSSAYQGEVFTLPDHVKDTLDDICQKILKCEVTGKLYKIIPQELKFYKKMNIALPRRAYKQRILDRIARKDPYRLWEHMCAASAKKIMAPYPPENGDIVYDKDIFTEMFFKEDPRLTDFLKPN